jgi:hypothetical protein
MRQCVRPGNGEVREQPSATVAEEASGNASRGR